ncbi:MAG: NAD(P)/FAD-dependent oxidoreductase [Anaerolineae bacterium]|nr:MAG: NAD(P)/FAD-dependent oxidoreductase [Anaerolineae bacterium]
MTGGLQTNGKVVIIGGGPAGTACALALQRKAAALGRPLKITVVEGKQFQNEQHYNQCAGVLSPPLPELLEQELGVPFPYHLSRGEITDYVLHAGGGTILLRGEGEPSTALRRVQFDAYMLEQTRQRGIEVLPARAMEIEFHADGVLIYTENRSLRADVVVGAFGLDEGTAALFQRRSNYRPPRALHSIVTKYHPGEAAMAAFGNRIHAFLPHHPHIEFGAVTPKGNHLTINIAGANVDSDLMAYFLQRPDVRAVLPPAPPDQNEQWHFFRGRFPYTQAGHFYGDRYVMIGDAAGLVRTFKGKGVTSAVLTGIRAAETILQHGISRQAFHAHYRAANQDILRDMPYGHLIRFFTIYMGKPWLWKVILQAAEKNEALQRALYNAVSAHAPYREVLRHTLKPAVMLALAQQFIQRERGLHR